jgi:hypothetical protein
MLRKAYHARNLEGFCPFIFFIPFYAIYAIAPESMRPATIRSNGRSFTCRPFRVMASLFMLSVIEKWLLAARCGNLLLPEFHLPFDCFTSGANSSPYETTSCLEKK